MCPCQIWLIFLCTYIFGKSHASLITDQEKCTLWLRTDGSTCDEGLVSKLNTKLLQQVPTVDVLHITCKDGTGTFDIANNRPFECHHELPDCMDHIKPKFYFYTPERNQDVQMIDYANLENSVKGLQTSSEVKPFVAIVHGFGKEWPKLWMYNFKDSLNAQGYNALIVQWTHGAFDPFYFKASANTRTVGAALGRIMRLMDENGKISLDTSTIAGWSLGGQVAGFAGASLNGRLRRIIGLDPAGPMFNCMDPKARLDPTDAQFVQVLHTNGDYFLEGGCGTLIQWGHLDFYIHGGVQQPGCGRGLHQAFNGIAHLNFTQMVEDVSCSHFRVPRVFMEMIDNAQDPETMCQYIAFPCNSLEEWRNGVCFDCPTPGCAKAGMLSDLGSPNTGKYYVDTLAENITTGQYCGRQFLVSLKSAKDAKGKITIKLKGDDVSKPYEIQNNDQTLKAGDFKKCVVVAPWQLTKVRQIEILYNRNTRLITGGYRHWSLQTVIVKAHDGTSVKSDHEVEIQNGVWTTIDLA